VSDRLHGLCAVTARYRDGRVLVEASSVERFSRFSSPQKALPCPTDAACDLSSLAHYHATMVLAPRGHVHGARPTLAPVRPQTACPAAHAERAAHPRHTCRRVAVHDVQAQQPVPGSPPPGGPGTSLSLSRSLCPP
jgi:hypothetical protein